MIKTPKQPRSIYNTQTFENNSNFHQTSKSNTIDYSNISGFNQISQNKQRYFKKKVFNNLARYKEIVFREKVELISKFIFYFCSNIINLFSVVIYIIETFTEKSIDPNMKTINHVFKIIDLSCGCYFIVEYFLLKIRSNDSLLKYIFTFESLVDLIIAAPSFLSFFFRNKTFVSVMQMIKAFRILRIYLSIKTLQYDTTVDFNMFNVNHIILDIVLIILVFLCSFIIATGFILGIQDLTVNSFNQDNLNFAEAFYYVIVTTTTLGYGDIYPTNIYSRFLIIILILCFISIVSNQITWLISILQLWGNYVSYSFKNHIILLIDHSINLFEVLSEIKKENHAQEVIIISNDIQRLPSIEFPYNKVFIINSSTIDLEILERANAKYAECFFVFTNKCFDNTDQTEKVNEFIILKIHQYYNHIPIYLQTLLNEKSFSSGNYLQNEMFLIHKKHDNAIQFIVPILRIKNIIESKALFNPGYANFIQNVIFNDIEIPEDLDPYDITMQGYFLGCQNKIKIRKIPNYFIGQEFYDVVRVIYTKSIKDYLIKVMLRDIRDVNRPVLLIGISESHSSASDILLFPKDHVIVGGCEGIFISYDEKGYLDQILSSFKGKMSEDENVTLNKKKALIIDIKEEDEEKKANKSKSNNEKPDNNKNDDVADNKYSRRKGIMIKPGLDQSFEKQITIIKCDTEEEYNEDKERSIIKIDSLTKNNNILSNLNQLVHQQPRINEFDEFAETIKDDSQNQICQINTNLFLNSNNNQLPSPKKHFSTQLLQTYSNTNKNNDDNENIYKPQSREHFPDKDFTPVINNTRTNKTIKQSSTNYKHKKTRERKVHFAFNKDKELFLDESFDLERNVIEKTKQEAKEYFIARKNIMITGNIYQDKSTTNNLLFLHSIEDSGLDSIQKEIIKETSKRYESLEIFDPKEHFYENRILDCRNEEIATRFDKHIVLFGYQDGIEKLITHIKRLFPNNQICVFVEYKFDDKKLIKLLQQNKTLYLLHGDLNNPFHLINIGLSKSKYAVFLINSTKSNIKEDMGNILSFKVIDNFFQTNLLLELWVHQSTIFVGYKPIDPKIFHNEFSHPLYICGRLVYLDHFDRIIVMAKKNKKCVEAWMQLLQLGSSTINNTNVNMVHSRRNDDTFTITLDIPSFYHKKEFYYLFTDLLCQKNPIMVLGLYIENPLEYLRLRSEGRINKFTRKFTTDIRISTSYKRHNMSEDKGGFDEGMLNFLKLAKKYSINDKIVMDYVDIKHPFMPIFITNPPPWFIISQNTKMLVLYSYQAENCGIECFQKQYLRRKKNQLRDTRQKVKEILLQRQDNFLQTINKFKDKIQNNYLKAFKIIETQKKAK